MSPASDRVLFVDVARAAAVLFMIQGHGWAVLLRPEAQAGTLFNAWLFLRGLTSCTFLMLAGLSFSLATVRHWDSCRTFSPRTRRRLARLATFLLLGYAMHLPISPLSEVSRIQPDQWQAFATVDILHLVAVTLAGLQGLAWLARTPRRMAFYSLVAAATVVLLTPIAWRIHWAEVTPIFLAAYLSAATGSLFPLFPWAAYVWLGAAVGVWFVQSQPRRAPSRMAACFVAAGAAMLGFGVLLHQIPSSPFGAADFWSTSPTLFLVKAGCVLVLLALAARITGARAALPGLVTALSQESLTIYFAHLCILYGSIWNTGLLQLVGPRLGPLAAGVWISGLVASMCLLALAWHACKRRRQALAVLVRATVAVAGLYVVR